MSYDIARGEFVHHCSAIGNAARHAHEALQENNTERATWWLDRVAGWVDKAKAVAPSAQPLDAETIERILTERAAS